MKNRRLFIILFSISVLVFSLYTWQSFAVDTTEIDTTIVIPEAEVPVDALELHKDASIEEDLQAELNAPHGESHEGEHSGDMSPLFFIIIALFIGTATHHLLQKSPLPYTVTLLIIGMIIGIIDRFGLLQIWSIGSFSLDVKFLSQSVEWAGNIDPHIILYVFLPTLLFEAAFALDVHTFKKSVTNAFILAVPGIIVALVITGAIMMGIMYSGMGLHSWTWPVALMFGTIVSATDPVAVVSLLKELGASKKLSTLIESESLLNDGTAIVIFMVFLGTITGAGASNPILVEFLRVALGGTFIGVIIGMIVINWVRKVFNDALFEITVIIGAAYLAFFMAEHFFHVSGVLAVVTFGLVMAGVGRTRISPEVGHFLHEFWELAAFIANTLIFIIVGVVIAQKVNFAPVDFLILAIVYVGIHIARAVVIAMFFPAMRNIGYGLTAKDATVAWWGGLRGAIGLALALIVASEESIPADIRSEILSITAGIVLLTSIINATTIKYLVNWLGLTKIGQAKAQVMISAQGYLRQSSENALEKLKGDRFMAGANWNSVKEYLPFDPGVTVDETKLEESIAETRKRILQKEKASYWKQFGEGLLGPSAVQRLSDDIDHLLDAGGKVSLAHRKDLEQFWKTPKLLNFLQSLPLIGIIGQRLFFERLAVSYDSARGFVAAQEEVQKLVGSMLISAESSENKTEAANLSIIEDEINENRIQGLTFLRNLKEAFPEVYNAIETRQAIRSLLNHQKHTIERLLKSGRLDPGEADEILGNIEGQMKKLIDAPPSYAAPEAIKFLHEASWLEGLDPDLFKKVVDSFKARVYSVGQKLFRENKPGDGLYIIVRGNVKVEMGNVVVDILGPGTVIGEMANLMSVPRTASVTAESPVTVLKMNAKSMNQLMKESKVLEERLWKIAGGRFVENYISKVEPYSKWKRNQLKKWITTGEVAFLADEEKLDLNEKIGVLLTGKVYVTNKLSPIIAPAILYATSVIVVEGARVYVCCKEMPEKAKTKKDTPGQGETPENKV
jgi:NhaP-type Na+/H+ or K+/H+ antiporter